MTYASLCGVISWAMTIKLPLLQRFYQSELLGPFRQKSKNTSNVLTLPNVRILYKWSCIPSIYKFRLDTLCVSSVVYFRVYHYIKWNLIHISTDRELLCIYIVLFLKKKRGGGGGHGRLVCITLEVSFPVLPEVREVAIEVLCGVTWSIRKINGFQNNF